MGEEIVDVTSETNWKYEFKDLPKYDEGKEIDRQ
ncbi:Cna B-type domain-containing protein [Staphylococcus aureus]